MGEYQLLSREESSLEILEERFQQFQCEFCRRILKSKEDAKEHQVNQNQIQNILVYYTQGIFDLKNPP